MAAAAVSTATMGPMQTAMLARSMNTLHGFNALVDVDGEAVLGVIFWGSKDTKEPAWEQCNEKLTATFGLKSLYRFFDRYVYPILSCPPELRVRSGEVIDAVRRLGFDVQLQTGLAARFTANTVVSLPFSKENAEKLAVQQLNEAFSFGSANCYVTHRKCDARLWCTAEGKEMAARLAKAFPTFSDYLRSSNIILKDDGLGPAAPHDFPVPVAAAALTSPSPAPAAK